MIISFAHSCFRDDTALCELTKEIKSRVCMAAIAWLWLLRLSARDKASVVQALTIMTPRRTLKRHCIGDVRIPGAVTFGRKRYIFSSAFSKLNWSTMRRRCRSECTG